MRPRRQDTSHSWKTTWSASCLPVTSGPTRRSMQASLRNRSLVMRELGSGSRRIVEQALEEAGLRHQRTLDLGMTFDSTEGLLSAVEAGLGIAFVSRWAVRNQLALGTLRLAHMRGLKLAQNVLDRHPRRPRTNGSQQASFIASFSMERAEAARPARSTGKRKFVPHRQIPIQCRVIAARESRRHHNPKRNPLKKRHASPNLLHGAR